MCYRKLVPVCLGLVVVAAATTVFAQAYNPYSYNVTIQSGSRVDFTANQYSGDSTDPSHLLDTWSGSTGVHGTMQATIWQTSAGASGAIQMNDVDIYGDSTIGYSKWFYMDTNWGDTRAQARVRNLHTTDAGVPGFSPVVDGNFMIADFQSQIYGSLDVNVQYYFLFGYVGIPSLNPRTEDLAAHNNPPPHADLGGAISGSGMSAVLSTSQSVQQATYMNTYSQEYGITCDYTLATTFNPSITAVPSVAPVLQLSADAGANTSVYGGYRNGVLNATGSYDPQGNTITSYAWDLNGDGNFTDKVGATATVTQADLAALGLGYGQHTVGLCISADDGYWATDQLTLSYLPSLPGDANVDGITDAADLNSVLSYYNTASGSNMWARGDFDGNGITDAADLNTVLSYYNQYAAGLNTAIVPEPGAVAMLLSLAVSLVAFGKWKRSR